MTGVQFCKQVVRPDDEINMEEFINLPFVSTYRACNLTIFVN